MEKYNMEEYNIMAIETLVNEMGDCYDYPSEEMVLQMNQLIGRDWDAETYWEYTCEYWSHHSLEETVYALINGKYPPCEKREYYVWNAKYALKEIMEGSVDTEATESDILEETHLFFRLGRYCDNRERFEKFNILPMDKIYQWFKDSFAEWEQSIFEHEDGRGSLSLSLGVEYGIERDILVFPYEEKCLGITFTNVEEEDINKALSYLKQFTTDIYQER